MSQFIVSARKYRPVRFDDVVGQQHVSQTLKNALQNDHLAHAFLFCGPRGVGKTTCARILAKVINCENITAEHEACDSCGSCKAFNENASFNITELDAASNNSVEHIRALIEQVRFQPQQGQYKVFIIDEVHMLSQQAFNAFLKTLEEPPPYAIFILATTEKHKIIPTILSRCQIFDFRRIQVADMVSHLSNICKEEGIDADKDALHIIGQKADGALRDALSIFDRIVSFSGKKIQYKDVIENLNILDYDYFFKIVDALLSEDLSSILLTFEDIQRKGFEADIFINGLAAHLRNILVCKDEQTLQLLEVSDNLKDRYQQQASLSPASFLISALNVANDCDVNYKMARNKRLHVEVALVKMVYLNRAVKETRQLPTTTASPEKKTADPSKSVATEPISSSPPPLPNQQAEAPSSTTPPPAQPQVNEVTEVPSPPTKEETAAPADPQPAINKTLNVKSKYIMPKLGNLDALDSQVAKEDAAMDMSSKELELATVQAAWDRYGKALKSPSARNTLKNASLAVVADTITVTVGSNMNKEMIQQENNLMEHLRKELQFKGLVLQIEVDTSRMPESTSKPKNILLTPKDKFLAMREKNPQVEELRKRFDLRPDNS